MLPFPIYLSAPGARVPSTCLTNEDQFRRVHEQFQGSPAEWRKVRKRLEYVFSLCGSEKRYVEEDFSIPVADYAVAASRDALVSAGVQPEEIDLLINSSVSRDYFEPATGMEIASKLKMRERTHVFDVTCACAGLLQAMHTVVAYMALHDDIRTAVVCAADINKGHICYDIQNREEVAVRAAGLTIGEAASAFVLSREPLESGGLIRAMRTESMPEYHDLCRAPVYQSFTSRSAELFRLNRFVPDHIRRTLSQLDRSPAEVDHWIFHQPSKNIAQKIVKALDIDSVRVPLTHGDYGNSVNSTVPLTLFHKLQHDPIRSGELLFLHSAAAGFQMVSSVVEWQVDSVPSHRPVATGLA